MPCHGRDEGRLPDTNTRGRRAGIAAVTSPADTVDSHAADTLTAGAGLNDPDAVDARRRGPGPHRRARRAGRGLRSRSRRRLLAWAGGSPRRRARAARRRDATERRSRPLSATAVRAAGIELREHALLRDLLIANGRVVGIELDGGERLTADAVILATVARGSSTPTTTNPLGATGEGIAAAIAPAPPWPTSSSCSSTRPRSPWAHRSSCRKPCGRGRDPRRRHRAAASRSTPTPMASSPRATSWPAPTRARWRPQGGRPVRLDATAIGDERLAQALPTIDAAVARARGLDWAVASRSR